MRESAGEVSVPVPAIRRWSANGKSAAPIRRAGNFTRVVVHILEFAELWAKSGRALQDPP